VVIFKGILSNRSFGCGVSNQTTFCTAISSGENSQIPEALVVHPMIGRWRLQDAKVSGVNYPERLASIILSGGVER
jgi:hypothetical protein